jgi:hypothetical protein
MLLIPFVMSRFTKIVLPCVLVRLHRFWLHSAPLPSLFFIDKGLHRSLPPDATLLLILVMLFVCCFPRSLLSNHSQALPHMTGCSSMFCWKRKRVGRVASPRMESRAPSRWGGGRNGGQSGPLCGPPTRRLEEEEPPQERWKRLDGLLERACLASAGALVVLVHQKIAPGSPLVLPTLMVTHHAERQHRMHVGAGPLHSWA